MGVPHLSSGAVVSAYLKSHPADWHLAATGLVFNALKEAFPAGSGRILADMDRQRFLDALSADDDLIRVMRAQLYLESQVRRFVDRALAHPERLEDTYFSWPARVDLAMACGLDPAFGPPLKKVGALRNKFAHDPDRVVIENKDVEDLFGAISDTFRKAVLVAFNELHEEQGYENRDFAKARPDQRFVCIVLLLCVALEDLANREG